eukprot:SAG31_NODE_587_length_13828_cov_2.438779_2_plen_191_part_00
MLDCRVFCRAYCFSFAGVIAVVAMIAAASVGSALAFSGIFARVQLPIVARAIHKCNVVGLWLWPMFDGTHAISAHLPDRRPRLACFDYRRLCVLNADAESASTSSWVRVVGISAHLLMAKITDSLRVGPSHAWFEALAGRVAATSVSSHAISRNKKQNTKARVGGECIPSLNLNSAEVSSGHSQRPTLAS